jgi:hypothetical protein
VDPDQRANPVLGEVHGLFLARTHIRVLLALLLLGYTTFLASARFKDG